MQIVVTMKDVVVRQLWFNRRAMNEVIICSKDNQVDSVTFLMGNVFNMLIESCWIQDFFKTTSILVLLIIIPVDIEIPEDEYFGRTGNQIINQGCKLVEEQRCSNPPLFGLM